MATSARDPRAPRWKFILTSTSNGFLHSSTPSARPIILLRHNTTRPLHQSTIRLLRTDAIPTEPGFRATTHLSTSTRHEHAPDGHHQCLPWCCYQHDPHCLTSTFTIEARHSGSTGFARFDAFGHSLHWCRHVRFPVNTTSVCLGKQYQQPSLRQWYSPHSSDRHFLLL